MLYLTHCIQNPVGFGKQIIIAAECQCWGSWLLKADSQWTVKSFSDSWGVLFQKNLMKVLCKYLGCIFFLLSDFQAFWCLSLTMSCSVFGMRAFQKDCYNEWVWAFIWLWNWQKATISFLRLYALLDIIHSDLWAMYPVFTSGSA